ncbi:tetratricopeptide repeat protein [Robertkochia aurantiaca]|uniref:tetratricopeptide repeat protein n=1 Tax=Robertkochia aurantiaca TaxID=2873700 RepID=UPI001CCA087E|nr:tetratricopeptide repeat protein [Robertkochia sp. 3YJGBD-33]
MSSTFSRLIVLSFFVFFIQLATAQDEAIAFQYLNNGKYEQAAAYYEKLYQQKPYNINYLQSLVKCYQQLEEYDKAEALLLEKTRADKVLPMIYIELGYNYMLQQQDQEAEKYYEKALEVIEENPNYAYSIGNSFRSKTLLDYAIKAFRKGMELDENMNFNYDLAYIYGEQGDIEKMYATYLDLIVERQNLKENIKRNIGRFLFDETDDTNNKMLKRMLLLRAQKDPNILWNELLSWLFVQEGQYSSAFTQEKAIYNRSEQPSLKELIDLGLIAYDAGEYSAADEIFTFVAEKTSVPDTYLQARLFNLKIAINREEDVEKIQRDFRELFQEFRDPSQTADLRILHANYLAFEMGESDQAISDLRELLNAGLDRYQEASVKMALGDILVYQEKFNQALIYFSQVQKNLKNDVIAQEARFKVAQTSFYKGDFEWAETQLKVLKSSTSQLIANDALQLKLLISDNSLDDSLQTALKLYSKADLMAYQNKNEEAIDLLEQILQEHKDESIEDEALFRQALLLEGQEAYEKAATNYKKIIEFFPEGILTDDALFQLAELYLGPLEDEEKAAPLLERLIFEHEDSIYFVKARKRFRQLRGDVIN